MSWANDMGYDIGVDIPEYTANEENWKQGFHIDQKENRYLLTEMTDSHLEACIKRFTTKDTTPLQKELNRRKLLTKAKDF